jgi:hypothetical protein
VGGISEILAPNEPLSHQTLMCVAPGKVVSHDQLMHLRLDRFVQQPHAKGTATADRAVAAVFVALRACA